MAYWHSARQHVQKNRNWYVCGFGLFVCAAGLWRAVATETPETATGAASIALATTFGMLFLGRGTAHDAIREPIQRSIGSTRDPEASLYDAFRALSTTKYADADAVGACAMALIAMEGLRESALQEGDRHRAGQIQTKMDQSVESLAKTKRRAVETLFEARLARSQSTVNRTAIRLHFDLLHREAWPLAILSIVSTLLTGFGEQLARALIAN